MLQIFTKEKMKLNPHSWPKKKPKQTMVSKRCKKQCKKVAKLFIITIMEKKIKKKYMSTCIFKREEQDISVCFVSLKY